MNNTTLINRVKNGQIPKDTSRTVQLKDLDFIFYIYLMFVTSSFAILLIEVLCGYAGSVKRDKASTSESDVLKWVS